MLCCKYVLPVSDKRARRAQRPRTAKIATVATVVINGKCQNSHTIVAADRAKIPKSAAIFVRACDESLMPASPLRIDAINFRPLIQGRLLNGHIVKTLIRQ